MPNIIKDKNGTHPQVFKRVDRSDTKITPIQINKSFTMRSGSTSDNHLALYANYVPDLFLKLILLLMKHIILINNYLIHLAKIIRMDHFHLIYTILLIIYSINIKIMHYKLMD